jgi:hypothetical protein
MRSRSAIAWLITISLFGGSVWLIRSGLYGWTLFALLPGLLGAVAVWVSRPYSQWRAVVRGAAAGAVGTLVYLGIGLEGLICVLMAMPLAIPSGALGGWITYVLSASRWEAQGVTLMMLLPLGTLSFDASAKPELYMVETAVTVAAPPEVVWKNVVEFLHWRNRLSGFSRQGWHIRKGRGLKVREWGRSGIASFRRDPSLSRSRCGMSLGFCGLV